MPPSNDYGPGRTRVLPTPVPVPARSVPSARDCSPGPVLRASDWRQSQSFVGLCVAWAAPSSTAAAEKLAAEAFGTAAYANYEEKTLDIVPPKYRAPGKDIKQVVDDLNRGTLRKDAWQLHVQKNLLSTDEERTSALTADIALTLSAPVATVDLAGHAEVLSQLEIFTHKMSAACLREVEPHPTNPHAGSKGSLGRVTVPDPAAGPTAEKVVTFHGLPSMMSRYRRGYTECIKTMTPSQIVATHNLFHERASGGLGALHLNYMSALGAELDMHSWHSMLHMLPPEKPLAAASVVAKPEDSDENKRLSSENKRLANELEQSRTALKRKKAPDTVPLCFDFQRARCTRGDACRFLHECEKCGSKQHGSANCPGR